MQRRIAFLDGLRAIAVLSVIAFHTASHNPRATEAMNAFALALLRAGCHGVDLFFVISGFCLSYPALARIRAGEASRFDAAGFAARRIVRIVPPYFAAIAVLLLLAGAFRMLHLPLPASMPQHGFSFADVVRQALFFDAHVRLLNGSFWTLAVEFRWYFLFPLVLWLWVRAPRAFGALAIAVTIAAVATRAQSIDLAVLPTFMLGIVAADLHLRDDRAVRVLAPPAFLLTFAAALATPMPPIFSWMYNPLWGLSMFFLVVSVATLPHVRAALSLKALTAVGFASYGIYLMHEPFTGLVSRLVPAAVGGWPLWIAGVAGAVCAGAIFSYVAERPFLSAPLRTRLLQSTEPAIRRAFQRLGIAQEIELARGASAPAKRQAVA